MLSDIKIGDEIQISVSVRDGYKNDEVWQNDIVNAVGGHMVFAKDGKNVALGDATRYPTTIIAETNSGKVLFIQNDGRQEGYSLGIRFSDYSQLTKAFDLKNAFIVDGGGSSSIVALEENGYALVNRPSDKKADGEYGEARTVVNSVILSYGPDRNAPEEDTGADQAPEADGNDAANSGNVNGTADGSAADKTESGNKTENGNKSSSLLLILLIGGSAVCLVIAVVIAVIVGNKKYGKS